jgi:hypothetical protein
MWQVWLRVAGLAATELARRRYALYRVNGSSRIGLQRRRLAAPASLLAAGLARLVCDGQVVGGSTAAFEQDKGRVVAGDTASCGLPGVGQSSHGFLNGAAVEAAALDEILEPGDTELFAAEVVLLVTAALSP